MSSVYEELVEDTEELIEMIHEKYFATGVAGSNVAYLPVISGIEPFKVEARPGGGHNYYAVVDAIHNCYARNKEAGFDAGFKDGINALIRVSSSSVGNLDQLIKIVFYQLDKQNDGTAQFSIDIEEIIGVINTLIRENKSNYEADNARFRPWLEKIQKYALEKYGLELG